MSDKIKEITLKEEFKIPWFTEKANEDSNGVFSFIYRGIELKEIQSFWDRKNCCLKIFKHRYSIQLEKQHILAGKRLTHLEPFSENLSKQVWGPEPENKGSFLKEATQIQNLFALHNLAPRVYAVFILIINGRKYWTQLTDDLGHWKFEGAIQDKMIKGPIEETAQKYGIEVYNDEREANIVADKYVDFQGFHLPLDYKERLKKRLAGIAKIGKWGPFENYQSIPELDIKGGRDTEHRIKKLHLDKIDFRGKTVLDVGCCEGMFSQYAAKMGAKRVVGIDLPEVAKLAAELAYYLGYYNIDFKGYDVNYSNHSEIG